METRDLPRSIATPYPGVSSTLSSRTFLNSLRGFDRAAPQFSYSPMGFSACQKFQPCRPLALARDALDSFLFLYAEITRRLLHRSQIGHVPFQPAMYVNITTWIPATVPPRRSGSGVNLGRRSPTEDLARLCPRSSYFTFRFRQLFLSERGQ